MIDSVMNPIIDRVAKVLEALLPSTGLTIRTIPAWTHLIGGTLVLVASVLAMGIFRARHDTSRQPRIHIFHDMDHQPKIKAQSEFVIDLDPQPFSYDYQPVFRDGRGMRPQVEGTVAMGELKTDTHYFAGTVGTDSDGNPVWAQGLPARVDVNAQLLARGAERYDIFCAICHGASGLGNGPVHERAQGLTGGTRVPGTNWVQPASLVAHDGEAAVANQPAGQIFNTISNGKGNMSSYKHVPFEDRWAIVAYVRALQRSQRASEADVPAPIRQRLADAEPGTVIRPTEGID